MRQRTPLSSVKLKAIEKANANIEVFSRNGLLSIPDSETLGGIINGKKAMAAVCLRLPRARLTCAS